MYEFIHYKFYDIMIESFIYTITIIYTELYLESLSS